MYNMATLIAALLNITACHTMKRQNLSVVMRDDKQQSFLSIYRKPLLCRNLISAESPLGGFEASSIFPAYLIIKLNVLLWKLFELESHFASLICTEAVVTENTTGRGRWRESDWCRLIVSERSRSMSIQ